MSTRGWGLKDWLANVAAVLAASIVLYGMFVVTK